MPNEKKAKSKCVEYLRHAEYYDMQSTFDELYARSQAGRDKYENLVLVLAPVHELIHAIDEDTIRSYLTALKLDTSQLTKLNKLRTLAKRKPIDLEKPNLTNNSHNGMTKETKKSV